LDQIHHEHTIFTDSVRDEENTRPHEADTVDDEEDRLPITTPGQSAEDLISQALTLGSPIEVCLPRPDLPRCF
jgi:hypothetical protein